MYRLFVAVDIPNEIKHSLAALCTGLPGVRWVNSNQMHLTLSFLGDVEENRFHDCKELLYTIKADQFTLTLKGIGLFLNKKRAQTLWVGLKESDELQNLHRTIDKALIKLGFPVDSRKFHPHITLGRIKKISTERLHSYIDYFSDYESAAFTVNEFILYSSILRPEGPLHKAEERYLLKERSTFEFYNE